MLEGFEGILLFVIEYESEVIWGVVMLRCSGDGVRCVLRKRPRTVAFYRFSGPCAFSLMARYISQDFCWEHPQKWRRLCWGYDVWWR